MTSEGRDDSRGNLGRQVPAWMPNTSHRVRQDRLLEACAKSRRGGETGVSPYPTTPTRLRSRRHRSADPGRAGGISVYDAMHHKVGLGEGARQCYGIAQEEARP
jgi:hypothetical protein